MNVKNKSQAKYVITSQDIYAESVSTLQGLGFEVYSSFNNTNVSTPVSKHVDMQLVHLGNNQYLCAPECYEYYYELFDKTGFNLIKGETFLSSNYPCDIAYNIIVTEKYAVHNFKHTDSQLAQYIKNRAWINVSQGYTACSVCRVNDSAFITADEGIYKALASYNLDVLKISTGSVLLPGYDTGFFGGACFRISTNTLAINGNIEYHCDCDKIISFCKSFNVDVLSLSDNPIMDIGSAVVALGDYK